MSFDQVAISRVALTASLGFTATQACAAARAGISRPNELGFVVEDVNGEATPVIGHAVRTLTDGFTGVARLTRICASAIDDLFDRNGEPSAVNGSIGFFLHVSDHFLHRAKVALAEVEGSAAPTQSLDVEWEGQAEFARSIRDRLVPAVTLRAGFEPREVEVVQGGPAAFMHALELAANSVARGKLDRAIVGATDSLLDVPMLESMAELNVLRTPNAPTGAMPGECAAFLMIEPSRPMRSGGTRLAGVARHRGTAHRFAADLSASTELRRCVVESFERFDPGSVGVCIATLNGDERRAHEYGRALLGLKEASHPADFALWCPAANFGETGAASTALSICLAARALERSYANGRSILVAVVSDDADRASFFVTASGS